MKISINLLQETQQIQARVRRIGLWLQTISTVVLIAFGVLVFLIISLTFWSDRQANRISEDIEDTKATIEKMRPLESKLLFVKQKLTFSGRVLSEHGVRQDLATGIYELSKEEVTLDHVAVAEDDDFLVFSATAKDIFSLVGFLDRLLSYAQEHEVTRVIGNSFSRAENGSYQFDISIFFIEK